MKEIGSEYYYEKLKSTENNAFHGVSNVRDSAFVFSGRTAIETVLLNEPYVKKAMLPAYCCDSMIEPFRKADIECFFYEVTYDDGLSVHVDIPENVDLLLWCNYFGFKIEMPDFSEFVRRGGIIVEDITHSFFSSKQCDNQSHYLVASLRKWGPLLSGGYCANRYTKLKYKPTDAPGSEYLAQKREAMLLKREYLYENKKLDKELFLHKFSESNRWLTENYSRLRIDNESRIIFERLDRQETVRIRRQNATILYEGLKDISSVSFLFKEDDMDCPLFVPVVMEKKNRDSIRRILIENDIYCPIHWPKPNDETESNLYDMELSLICDQRYEESDMRKIVEVFRKWKEAK